MCAQSEDLQSEYYSINDGLTDRVVTAIQPDEQGFIWVGTQDGLNRFDGYEFLQFRNNENELGRISRSDIDHIARDRDGRLAVFYRSFFGFFDLFDPHDFSLTQVELTSTTGIKGHPRCFAVDRMGRIFTVTIGEGGTRLYEYTPAGFSLVWRSEEIWLNVATAVHLLPLDNGRFLLYDTQHGLRHLGATGELIGTIELPSTLQTIRYGTGNFDDVQIFYQDKGGRVWLSFFNRPGIYRWSGHELAGITPSVLLPVDSTTAYTDIWEDGEGNLLFNQTSLPTGEYPRSVNLYCLNKKEEVVSFDQLLRLTRYLLDVQSENFFGTLFLGTDTGLRTVRSSKTSVTTFLDENGLGDDQRGEVMRGLVETATDGIFFISEDIDLWHLDPATDVVTQLDVNDEVTGRRIEMSCGTDLLYDRNGYLWIIGCQNNNTTGVLVRYDIAECSSRAYPFSERFTCLSWNADSTAIYLGGLEESESAVLVRFDLNGERFNLITDAENTNFVQGTSVRSMCWSAGPRPGLFLGTRGRGLFFYDPFTRTVINYGPPPENSTEEPLFTDYSFISIYQDTIVNELYLGSRDGIQVLNLVTGGARHIGSREGLSGKIVCGIIPDHAGSYWISTYYGLTYYRPSDQVFRRFYRSDGLAHNEFNRFSYLRGSNGRLYFGGVNGLNAFYPGDLINEASTSTVRLTQVSTSGRDGGRSIRRNLDRPGKVAINTDEKSFAVEFMLTDYTRPTRNRFRARLDGYDTDWVELNNQHSVRYHNLPGGNYLLHVQGADPNGNYTTSEMTLPIRVYQAIYEKTWFWALIVIVLVGLTYGFLQNRHQERLREERLRTQISSDLHDEVSGLLAGITMQSEILQGYTEDTRLRSKLETVGEAGRKAMAKMGDVIWSIDSRRDTLGDLLSRMREHADDVLLPLEIRYHFRTERLGGEQQKISANIRQDVYFVYKECINNIAKHSSATQVDIYLGNQGNQFELVIHDNGMLKSSDNGVAKSVKKGQGLMNLNMRAERLRGRIKIETKGGYTVRLQMRKFV